MIQTTVEELEELMKKQRAVTVREIAEAFDDLKRFTFHPMVDHKDAVKETAQGEWISWHDAQSALWSLLGGKGDEPDGVNPCPDCGAHPGTIHHLGCKFDGVR